MPRDALIQNDASKALERLCKEALRLDDAMFANTSIPDDPTLYERLSAIRPSIQSSQGELSSLLENVLDEASERISKATSSIPASLKATCAMTFGRFSQNFPAALVIMDSLLNKDPEKASTYDYIFREEFRRIYGQDDILTERVAWRQHVNLSQVPKWVLLYGPLENLYQLLPIVLKYTDDHSRELKLPGLDMLSVFICRSPSEKLFSTGVAAVIAETIIRNLQFLDDSDDACQIQRNAARCSINLIKELAASRLSEELSCKIFHAACLYVWQYKSGQIHFEEAVLSYLPDLCRALGHLSLRYETAVLTHLSKTLESLRYSAAKPVVAHTAQILDAMIEWFIEIRNSGPFTRHENFAYTGHITSTVCRSCIVCWGANEGNRPAVLEKALKSVWRRVNALNSEMCNEAVGVLGESRVVGHFQELVWEND